MRHHENHRWRKVAQVAHENTPAPLRHYTTPYGGGGGSGADVEGGVLPERGGANFNAEEKAK